MFQSRCLWMTAAGAGAAAVYDFFRIFRRLFKMPDWAVFICDIFFWTVCTVLSFEAVMYSNYGELRWFVFAGIAIGGVIYFTLLSAIVSKTVLFLLRIIVRVCLLVKKILFYINRLFAKPRRFISVRTARFVKYCRYILEKPKTGFRILKKIRKMGR